MLAQGLPTARRVAVRGLQGLVVAGTLLYAGSTLVRTGPSVLLDGWVVPLIGGGAGLLCLARALLVGQGRAAWAILGVGQGLYALGTIYWWRWVAPLAQQPYPSLADLLWLSFYPLAYVALVLLVRQRIQRLQASMWLDGLVGGLGAAGLAAGLAFGTILDATGGGGPRSRCPSPIRRPICCCWCWARHRDTELMASVDRIRQPEHPAVGPS
jgi:hypothetical protein